MKRTFKWVRGHKKLTLILVIVAIGAFLLLRPKGNGKDMEEATVARGDVAEEMILSGNVNAREYANLHLNASGTIAWVGVSAGDVVYKGQPLLKLDTVKLNSAYQIAAANYRAAEANAEQILDSVKGHDNDETFEERNIRTAAETARDKAYEALVAAQKDLREATLVAPFAGVVSTIQNESPGLNVTAGTPQITIINPETVYFSVSADQSEVTNISVGQKVKIILDAIDDKEFTGTVKYISFTTRPDEIGAVYEVRVEFDDLDTKSFTYRVGMTGDAYFVLAEKKNVVYVPTDFVKSDSQGDYVLLNHGKEKRYIEVGLEGEERTEVLSGLEEGVLIYD